MQIIETIFCFDDKILKRQPRQVQPFNEKCDLVSAKAFFKILNFVKCEMEEQADKTSLH